MPVGEGLEHPDLPDGTGEFLDAWLMLVEKMVNPSTVLESPHALPAKGAPHGHPPFSALRFLVVTQKVREGKNGEKMGFGGGKWGLGGEMGFGDPWGAQRGFGGSGMWGHGVDLRHCENLGCTEGIEGTEGIWVLGGKFRSSEI